MPGSLPLRKRAAHWLQRFVEVIPWSVLPYSARLAIIDGICCRGDPILDRYILLSRLAARRNIAGFYANGQFGTIRGSVSDGGMFGVYAQTGVWAPELSGLVAAYFERKGGGTFLDIGANIGLTTIPISRNPKVRCIAFEPAPANFENLAINVSANCPAGNVSLRQIALFDRATTIDFELSDQSSGDHRIRIDNRPGALGEERRSTISVPTIRLDDAVSDVDPPLVVKMDIQGAEPFAFAGGRNVLSKAGLLILEWWPYGMRRLHADPSEITHHLEDYSSISLAQGTELGAGEISPPMPASEACAKISKMALETHGDYKASVDIIAWRSPDDARDLTAKLGSPSPSPSAPLHRPGSRY